MIRQDNGNSPPLHRYVGEVIIIRTGQTIAERFAPTVAKLRRAFAPANDHGHFSPPGAA